MLNWMMFTKLADTVVLVPASLLCVAWLLFQKQWRPAIWWLALLGGGLALVAISKLAFVGWGIGNCALDFTGISGHAMRATAIMPVLLYLAVSNATAQVRAMAFSAGLLFGFLIGVSRLALQVHSVSEVVSGCLLGAAISLVFAKMLIGLPRPVCVPPALALGLLLLAPAPLSQAAPTEQWLEQIALSLSGREAPYRREDLQQCARGAPGTVHHR
jgi:membrane-associated phospholipid phosphatase